jgi:hypothetical protein
LSALTVHRYAQEEDLMLYGLVFVVSSVHADEGMWPPEQLVHHEEMLREAGIALSPRELADWRSGPMGAVARLGGCSAAFVSSDGLLMTNGHCVRSYLRYASGDRGNLLEEGYSASYPGEELWAGPAARLYIVERSEPVTEQVAAYLRRRMTDEERAAALEQARKELTADCESDPAYRCRVVDFYGGQEYRLITERVFQDIRIVYAPPESVVFFGGEADNWRWPRHAGDIALMRVYAGPEGQSARYAQDNHYFHPESWLKVSVEGVDDGDVVFQGGYPGETFRYRTAAEIEHAMTVRYPGELEVIEEMLGLLRQNADVNFVASRQLQNTIFSLANRQKYLRGMLESLNRTDLIAQKQREEQALSTWIEVDGRRSRAYGRSLDELNRIIDAQLSSWERDYLLERACSLPQLLYAACTTYRLSLEREKPDSQRREGFQERDVARLLDRSEELEQGLYLPAERDIVYALLRRLSALPAEQRSPAFDRFIDDAGGTLAAVELLFQRRPTLASAETRATLLSASREHLESSPDPWIQLAVALETWQDELRPASEAYQGALSRLWPVHMTALRELRPNSVYPDANGTLRVSVGRVTGYSPSEAVSYLSYTTTTGLVAKSQQRPVPMPRTLVDRISLDSPWVDPALGGVPLNFLTTLDSAGGNSGSPTLNAQGEVVGLVFDRTYEAMSADWEFDPGLTRSIHVDVRFLLWLLSTEDSSQWLLEELDVESH